MLLNELTASQYMPQSKQHAKRLASIFYKGNDDRYNPNKAVRDPEDNSIRGPGGPKFSQPTPQQAALMLRRAGIDLPPVPPGGDSHEVLKSVKQKIDASPSLPDNFSPNADAQRKLDYIPGERNNFNPPRWYGDGSQRIGFGRGTQGRVWPAELVPLVKAFKKAFKKGDAKAAHRINSLIYKKSGMRIGGAALRTTSESKSKEGFASKLDEALGL